MILDTLAALLNHFWLGFFGGIIALIFSYFWLKNKKEWAMVWITFIVMQGVVWAIKYLIHTERPAGNHHLTNPGFPSGVAADMGFLATYASLLYPKYWFLWHSVGISISLLRLYNGAHYWTDVVGGYFIGVVVIQIMKKQR